MKFLRTSLLIFGCLFFLSYDDLGQITHGNTYPPPYNWIATCMIGGHATKHFLLLPDGEVTSFAPGGKLEVVPGIDNVIAIAAGNYHILALKRDGTVWSWGSNDEFQLGNKTLSQSRENSETPVQVNGIMKAVSISAFFNTSFALIDDGTIRAWGNGNMGMTGDGKEITDAMTTARISGRPLPIEVQGIKTAVAISGTIALLSNGEVVSWGSGKYGRLGNNSDESTAIPVKVEGIKNAIAVSSREDGGLALLGNGEVWAWGKNYKGQLGNGATHIDQYDHSSVPVLVKGIKNAVAISADASCFALLQNGEVMGWGWGELGALGSKGGDVNSIPLRIPGLGKAIAIKAGNGSGFALLEDGTLMGWGANMVATGIYHQSYTPIKIAKINLNKPH